MKRVHGSGPGAPKEAAAREHARTTRRSISISPSINTTPPSLSRTLVVKMKSRKKPSIKDFFNPVPRKTPESAKDAPRLQGTHVPASFGCKRLTFHSIVDATSTRPGPTGANLHQVPAPQSTNTSVAHSSPSASAVPPVPINNSASSPDAQPPTTSQTSINSGVSKRVVSNGEHVVLDSDNDSLEELDFGVPTTGFKAVAPITRSKRATQFDEDGLRKPEKKVKSKQNHLDRVVQTAKKTRELVQ